MEGHSCLQTTCCPVMCLLSLTFAISSCLINYWSFLMHWQDLLIFHLFMCSPHLEWSQSHCCPETDHVSSWWCVTFTIYCSQIFALRRVNFCWRIHSRIHCRVQQLFICPLSTCSMFLEWCLSAIAAQKQTMLVCDVGSF